MKTNLIKLQNLISLNNMQVLNHEFSMNLYLLTNKTMKCILHWLDFTRPGPPGLCKRRIKNLTLDSRADRELGYCNGGIQC